MALDAKYSQSLCTVTTGMRGMVLFHLRRTTGWEGDREEAKGRSRSFVERLRIEHEDSWRHPEISTCHRDAKDISSPLLSSVGLFRRRKEIISAVDPARLPSCCLTVSMRWWWAACPCPSLVGFDYCLPSRIDLAFRRLLSSGRGWCRLCVGWLRELRRR